MQLQIRTYLLTYLLSTQKSDILIQSLLRILGMQIHTIKQIVSFQIATRYMQVLGMYLYCKCTIYDTIRQQCYKMKIVIDQTGSEQASEFSKRGQYLVVHACVSPFIRERLVEAESQRDQLTNLGGRRAAARRAAAIGRCSAGCITQFLARA